MKTEHYPSLELCKKLTEIGFPRTQYQYEKNNLTWLLEAVCPSVMELWDLLPKYIQKNHRDEDFYKCELRISKDDVNYHQIEESEPSGWNIVVHLGSSTVIYRQVCTLQVKPCHFLPLSSGEIYFLNFYFMLRKVIQVSSGNGTLVALCNDGTIWDFHGGNWGKLPDIPEQ